jgi:uncharacterized protein
LQPGSQEYGMFNRDLLDILVCPVSKEKLEYDEKENVLVCYKSRLKYPIEDDIPIMLPERAEKF